MKATDIKDKTSSHSSQNLRGRTLIFLAIYVLETCGPVAPHCARMTNFMKHQKKFSSQCTTSPIFKLISTTVWILWQFEKVPFFAPLGVIFPFSFLLGRGSTPDPKSYRQFGSPRGQEQSAPIIWKKKYFPRNQFLNRVSQLLLIILKTELTKKKLSPGNQFIL